MAPPGRLGRHPLGIGRVGGDHRPAGAGQAVIGAAGLDLLGAPADELVHIAVIVGEQNIGLDVLGRGAGVVAQPGQREVHPRPVEQRQRMRRVGLVDPAAVGHLVADVRQLGGGEETGQLGGGHPIQPQAFTAVEHVGVGNFLLGQARGQHHAVVAHHQPELLDQIVAEQGRPGDAGGVDAGAVHSRERPSHPRRRALGCIGDAQFRIGEGAAGATVEIGAHPVAQIGRQRMAKIGHRPAIDLFQVVDEGG